MPLITVIPSTTMVRHGRSPDGCYGYEGEAAIFPASGKLTHFYRPQTILCAIGVVVPLQDLPLSAEWQVLSCRSTP